MRWAIGSRTVEVCWFFKLLESLRQVRCFSVQRSGQMTKLSGTYKSNKIHESSVLNGIFRRGYVIEEIRISANGFKLPPFACSTGELETKLAHPWIDFREFWTGSRP